MENYIVINGQKAELTYEQLKALGLVEPSPFEREKDARYWVINSIGQVELDEDMETNCDDIRHSIANYCTDREMMQQQAYRETLNRLLWRYSMEHKGDVGVYSPCRWNISYDYTKSKFEVGYSPCCKLIGTVYFATEEIAENAITEIIEPFMAEHPDFKF